MKFKLTFLLLIVSFILLIGCSKGTSQYDAFALCITKSGAAMYGTEWCSHCNDQKELFGSSFKFINFIDCDKRSSECDSKGVEGYPTWIIDGEKYEGTQEFYSLSELTGCDIISSTDEQSE